MGMHGMKESRVDEASSCVSSGRDEMCVATQEEELS
jgi:hypothetical protein